MELRTFIKETLKDIMGGVSDAQEETKDGIIVPQSKNTLEIIETGFTKIQVVNFEVGVTTSESEGKEGKINVVAAVFGAGVSGESSSASGQTARLSFKVPIQLPVGN